MYPDIFSSSGDLLAGRQSSCGAPVNNTHSAPTTVLHSTQTQRHFRGRPGQIVVPKLFAATIVMTCDRCHVLLLAFSLITALLSWHV